jgi:hypothetical protein
MTMDLDMMTIDPAEAEAKIAEFERSEAQARTQVDRAIAMAYRAVARGLGVIRLSKTIEAGGYFGNGLPKIAVIRADARQCFCFWEWDTALVFTDEDWRTNRGALVGRHSVRVRARRPAIVVGHSPTSWSRGQTMVPLIPLSHRPRPRRLAGMHLLWEVEAWDPVPPVDPALIKHLGGDLWVVLDTFNLTELERAVLAGGF